MLLVVQFRDDVSEDHEQKCIVRHLENRNDVLFINALTDTKRDWTDLNGIMKGVDHVVLGGSGNLSLAGGHGDEMSDAKAKLMAEDLGPLLNLLIDKDIPTLGSCFGHQIIAQHLGAKVIFDKEQAETGIFEIKLFKEGINDPLFAGVPEKFNAVVGHQDSVVKLPKDTILLAKSEKCGNHAFRYKTSIYGTQFHGELNTADLIYRLNLYPSYKEYAANVKNIDTSNALKVLKNFLDL